MHDAVGVDIKCHFNLWDTARCRWQIDELKLAECLVVVSHLALALQHVNFYRWLHVIGRCKHFGTTSWNSGVAFDEFCHHSTLGFDTKRKWSHVEQQNIFHVAAQYSSLHCCTDGNNFVRVYCAVWLFAGEALDQVLYCWHAS